MFSGWQVVVGRVEGDADRDVPAKGTNKNREGLAVVAQW